MKKYYLSALLTLCVTALVIFLSPTESHGDEIAKEIIRLHVIANSDSVEDQDLKLTLRDAIMDFMSLQLSNAASADEIRNYINEHNDELEAFARDFVQENGYDYPVSVSLATCYFPTKTYGDLVFPCGDYEALKVVIGDGDGRNWWCVLYPPLCFIGVTDGVVPPESKQMLQNLLSEEDYESLLITNYEKADVKVKFKFLEWLKE